MHRPVVNTVRRLDALGGRDLDSRCPFALMFRLLLALAVCLTPGAALNVGPLSLARPVATVPRAALIVCEEKVKPKGAQCRKRKSYIERLKGPSKGYLGRDTRVCKVPLL